VRVSWRARERLRRSALVNSDGKFPEIFTGGKFPYDVRASIFACLFFTVISMFREIFTILSMFL
jgi:hypothetical protein